MRLFGRYMFRQALGAVIMVVASLTAIVWIAVALRQLSVITSDGQSALVLLQMTTLVLPDIMTMIAPLAMLIACLHVLNRLNSDSELIVMTAAGTNIWRYFRALLPLAALISLLVGLASFYVVPWSLQRLGRLVGEIRADIVTQVLQPGQFVSPEAGITLHIRDRGPDGALLGLLLSDTRDAAQHLTYLAETSIVQKEGAKDYLLMRNGNIIRTDPKKAAEGARTIAFDSYVIDLSALAPKGAADPPKPHAQYASQLLNPDKTNFFYVRNPRSFAAELHDRIAGLLYPFTFLMCAVAFVGQVRSNRQARTKTLILAFCVAIGLRLGGMAAVNLANQREQAAVFVYAIPICGFLIAMYMAHRGMRPMRKSRLARLIEALLGGATDRLAGMTKRLRWRRSEPAAVAEAGGAP